MARPTNINLGPDGSLQGSGGARRQGIDLVEELDEVSSVCTPGFNDARSYDTLISVCDRINCMAICDCPEEVPNSDLLKEVAAPPRTPAPPAESPPGEPPSGGATSGGATSTGGPRAGAAHGGTPPARRARETGGLRAKTAESGNAAYYYPWLKCLNAVNPSSPDLVPTPPCGHIAGIYARVDARRGVFKAPANELVNGALDVVYRVTDAEQGGLNQAGVNVIRFFSGAERLVGGLTGAGEAHAQLIAQAELDRAVASELTLRGTAQGDPALRPGSAAAVTGVAGRLAGTYILTEVVHSIDPETGYLAEISSRPPPPAARPAAIEIALGKVSTVDDPEGLGRVRVRLPAFGGIETGWLQVLGIGAGAGKGLSVLPDTDDQVLIALARGELDHAIVLGGLYGDANPDPGVEGGNVRRFSLQTAGGQRLSFDDQRRTLRISDAAGSHFEIGPERVSLHSRVPLTIEAPGNSLVFVASTIDFERR